MNLVPAQYKAPLAAQVNLLPPEVGEKRERKRRRGVAFLLLALLVLAVAAGYVFTAMLVASAKARADEEAQRTTDLQNQIAALTEVDRVKAQISNAENARQFIAANEIYWPLLFASIDGALPEGVVVTDITHQLPDLGVTPPNPSGPFDVAGIGTVNVTLAVPGSVEISSVEDKFNAVPLFLRSYVTAIREGDGGAVPEGTLDNPEGAPTYLVDVEITLSYEFLMQRYSQRWFGTDDEDVMPLLDYYRDFADRVAAGLPAPEAFPPMPPTTVPPFVPGQSGVVAAPESEESEPSPSPSPEAAS